MVRHEHSIKRDQNPKSGFPKSEKLMFMAHYTIVNWGPHGIWLSNCSDDINNTIYDYVTQVAQKITNSSMKHFHEKNSLAGLTVKWHLLALNSSSINESGLNNETSENTLQILKNLKSGLDISQTPIVVIVTIYFIIISHISYKLVFPFLTIMFVVYHCLYAKIIKVNKLNWSRPFL